MQPFNINVGDGTDCQLFTVLPKESFYLIIVEDRVVAAIKEQNGSWLDYQLDEEEIKTLGLSYEASVEGAMIPTLEIGNEITMVLAGLPEPNTDRRCT